MYAVARRSGAQVGMSTYRMRVGAMYIQLFRGSSRGSGQLEPQSSNKDSVRQTTDARRRRLLRRSVTEYSRVYFMPQDAGES